MIDFLGLDFAGAWIVLTSALACAAIGLTRRRSDRTARFPAACGITYQIVGMALFFAWLAQSDPLFWHRQGPASLLFAALASSVVGLVAMIAATTASIVRREAVWARLWGILALLMLAPSLFVVSCGVTRTQAALRDTRLRTLDGLRHEGRRGVPQLVVALDSKDEYIQNQACFVLAQLGPDGKAAGPALVSYLDRTAGTAAGPRLEAITALSKVSPDEAVPVYLRMVRSGRTSWYERRAMKDALVTIGMGGVQAAVPAWDEIRRYDDALAERQLPIELARLASDDPAEVERAAKTLDAMGAYALPALPVLQKRADELKARTADRGPGEGGLQLAWLPAASAVDHAVFSLSLAGKNRAK